MRLGMNSPAGSLGIDVSCQPEIPKEAGCVKQDEAEADEGHLCVSEWQTVRLFLLISNSNSCPALPEHHRKH